MSLVRARTLSFTFFSLSDIDADVDDQQVYRISSRTDQGETVAKSSVCEIERRYNDFVLLHQELRRKADGVGLPDLPPKRFNNMAASVIEKRKGELQTYLNKVSSLPNDYGRDTIEAFLGTSFSTSLESDAMNPYGWANRTQQSGTLRTHFRRTSSNANTMFDICAIL